MDTTWILLANASRARICELDAERAQLTEVADFVHPQSRQKGSALDTDRPGQVMRSMGTGMHGHTAYEARTDVHDKEHERFARELAQYLEQALQSRRFTGLVLVASSPFLGELRSHLGDAASKAVRGTLGLDLTALGVNELRDRVPEITACMQ